MLENTETTVRNVYLADMFLRKSQGTAPTLRDFSPLQPAHLRPVAVVTFLWLPSLSFDRDGAVIFVGMDTPELPWTEVLAARHAAEKDDKAYICPGSRAKIKFSCVSRRPDFSL